MHGINNQSSNLSTLIIFLHIPKTAGSTLNNLLWWQYQPEKIFTVDDTRVPESISDLIEYNSPLELNRAELKLIRGHMTYGLHKFFP